MPYSNIDRSSDYFRVKTYTGNGADNRAITFDESTNMQPDFCWFKDRTGANSHNLFDVIRGVQKPLLSNSTSAELSGYDLFDSFNTNGFTVSGSTADNTNFNGSSFVNWSWKANGAGVSNTAGTISSTVSANTTSGFSIVSYTGNGSSSATVGHGLGVTPALVIIKPRDALSANGHWYVKHKSLASNNNIFLNLTNATTDVSGQSAGGIGNLSSSSTFGFVNGTSNISSVNVSSGTYIAYCFAEVKGYSKFGSYTGNGSTDGTFVYTGFKPAFIMLKSSSSGAVGWITHDNKRIGFNPNNYYVEPNNSNAESADTDKILLLSNGFKLISTSASWNSSGGTYIYMAFSENPFVSSKGIACTAR